MITNLFTMLIDLLNNDKCTAQNLASKLEVSQRTIYRYVDTLSFSQIPVYTKKGRDGGIMIGKEFRLYSQYFTQQEWEILLSALENSPNFDSTKTIIGKIKTLNKERFKDSQYYINQNFVIDKSNWSNNKQLEEKMNAIIKAKDSKTCLNITYHNRDGKTTQRLIEPYVVIYSEGMWYIYAWCRTRSQMRTFKISRMTHIFNTNIEFIEKKYQQQWDFTDHINNTEKVNVVLKVKESARYDMEEWLGVENVKPSETDSYYIASGEVNDNDITLRKLLSFGSDIQVISPLSMIDKLKTNLQQMNLLYSSK